MELYARVRRAVQIEQMSEREAARTFGLSRETVRKMLKFSLPPGYRRQAPIRRPKLEAYMAIIDQILELDKSIHRKQRHSVKRIFERLRDEHGYLGGYTVVKDYVREQKQRRKEMFVPLKHPPGHAQVDFGEADIYVNGVLERTHFFVMDLPHSDDAFVMAFPAETTEAFCEGHNQAFAYFSGVPQTILYDNTKIAVAQILGNGTRQKTVPVEFGHREVMVKGYVHEVVIHCGTQEIARHVRCYQKHDAIYEPRHYLLLLEQKTNALDQAAPLAEWQLPEEFARIRRLLESRQGKKGKREYVQILRLLEHFSLPEVQASVQQALQLQAISFDAVKHLVLCRIERKPPRLDVENYPHLPAAQVALTAASDYLPLLAGGAC